MKEYDKSRRNCSRCSWPGSMLIQDGCGSMTTTTSSRRQHLLRDADARHRSRNLNTELFSPIEIENEKQR
ncbi:hypothetical protein M0804_012243 [Polistes exclamans]|nr:hypothetical protein M0804_012243 [Polistes exclamans]